MNDQITAAVVRWARALIADPEHFVQGHDAVDGVGFAVPVTDPAACRWCAVGAVARTLDSWQTAILAYRLKDAARRTGVISDEPPFSIAVLNDGEDGHARVLAFLDRLADALEREAVAS